MLLELCILRRSHTLQKADTENGLVRGEGFKLLGPTNKVSGIQGDIMRKPRFNAHAFTCCSACDS